MNQQTGAIRIAAAFPNPGGMLRPGQFGRVTRPPKYGAAPFWFRRLPCRSCKASSRWTWSALTMSKFFIRRPIVAIVIAILTVIIGAVSMLTLPTSQYPDIVPPEIQVQATYPGADAKTLAQACRRRSSSK
jgi:hypothetical protein